MSRFCLCLGYLVAITVANVVRAEGGESGQSVVPAGCDVVDRCIEHRVYEFEGMATDAGCDSLARAYGWLRRDIARSQNALFGAAEPLMQSREAHWVEGQIWLALGNASKAYEALRPERSGWSPNPYVLWDLAVAAAVMQQNSVGIEAYYRLLQTDIADERARLALRLELAVLETRRPSGGIAAARAIVSSISQSDTDPDTCPWVAGARILVDALDGASNPSRDWACARERRWSRYLDSSAGPSAVFSDVPSANDWLRMPRNERMSLVALGLGQARAEMRRHLWDAVDVTAESPLYELRRRELVKLTRGL